MRTLKVAKELMTRYGGSLLFLGYRDDENHRERPKTAELIIRRHARKREARHPGSWKPIGQAGRVARLRVALRIGWRERGLRRRVSSGGGWRDRVWRIWTSRRDVTQHLNLLHWVVGGGYI